MLPLREGHRKLEAGQAHLNTWEGDGVPSPGMHFKGHEEQGSSSEVASTDLPAGKSSVTDPTQVCFACDSNW